MDKPSKVDEIGMKITQYLLDAYDDESVEPDRLQQVSEACMKYLPEDLEEKDLDGALKSLLEECPELKDVVNGEGD